MWGDDNVKTCGSKNLAKKTQNTQHGWADANTTIQEAWGWSTKQNNKGRGFHLS